MDQMKRLIIILAITIAFVAGASAQHRKLTVVLIRHAEKDVSATADKVNPVLTAEGKQRAENLIRAVRKYKFDAVYSSDFIRTRETVAPLAAKRRLRVQIYNPRELKQMSEMIMSGKIKRLLIVGHNNTTPGLTNLLLGREEYTTLPESVYDKIFVVKIRRYKRKAVKAEVKVLTY